MDRETENPLVRILEGLEVSVDETGAMTFGSEEAYREFMRRVEKEENSIEH